MKHTFTQNDLIRYMYQETSVSEHLTIKDALRGDAELRQDLELLQDAAMRIPAVKFNPSSNVLSNILQYSKQTSLETHL